MAVFKVGRGDRSYRSRMVGEERESFFSFPILAALARRPMTTRELSHVLLVTKRTVLLRLRELEAQGYVTKRERDRRWMQIVSLQVGGLPQPVSVPGVHPPVPTNGALPPSKLGPPREQTIIPPPQDDPGPYVEPPSAILATPPPSMVTSGPVGSVAAKLAKHFKVPPLIEGKGELSIGAVLPCVICTRLSPLKYGSETICPNCSRLWERADGAVLGNL